MSLGWLGWAAALGIGFPALMIVSGLLATKLRRSGSPYQSVVKNVQNLLLPMAVLYLLSIYVLDGTRADLGPRILLTITLLSALHVVLAFVAEIVFGTAPEDTMRARTPKLLRDIVIVVIVAAGGAVIMATVWEKDVAGIVTALGIGSIVLGLALQETLGNVMSGIALLMERPFSEGDFVEIDSVEGTVDEINWRATRLTNRLGDQVILPHSITSTARIVNNTSRDSSDAIKVELGFGYEHPPNDVKDMIYGVLRATEGVLTEPEPRVFTVDYGDSAVVYRVVFRVDHPLNKFPVRDRFMTRIWYAAQRQSINIPFPIRTVHNYDGNHANADPKANNAMHKVRRIAIGITRPIGLSIRRLGQGGENAALWPW